MESEETQLKDTVLQKLGGSTDTWADNALFPDNASRGWPSIFHLDGCLPERSHKASGFPQHCYVRHLTKPLSLLSPLRTLRTTIQLCFLGRRVEVGDSCDAVHATKLAALHSSQQPGCGPFPDPLPAESRLYRLVTKLVFS